MPPETGFSGTVEAPSVDFSPADAVDSMESLSVEILGSVSAERPTDPDVFANTEDLELVMSLSVSDANCDAVAPPQYADMILRPSPISPYMQRA